MMLRVTFLLWVLICALQLPFRAAAQEDSISRRIVIIGDAGELVNGRAPVIDAARKLIPLDKNTTVLFMGDNLYSTGLPDEQYSNYNDKRRVLDSQVAIVKDKQAKAYFMPGNHDWGNGRPQGFESIIREQIYIDQISKDNVKFFPEDGCPGPVEIQIADDVVLIIMDSQWWLNRRDRPGIESDCPYKTEEEVLEQLKDILERNAKKLVLFGCHHPFKSTGYHSGYYSVRQHIFPFVELNKYLYIPLPLLGSIYPLSRMIFGSPQDIKHPAYAKMVASIDNVLKLHPYVIHMHGHEHTLQYIKDSNNHYIVSGAGCKTGRIGTNKKVRYSAKTLGFVTLDISKNKNVSLSVYKVPITSAPEKAYTENILNFSKFPVVIKDTITDHQDAAFKDSVTIAINPHFAKVPWLTRKITGNNYRKEWSTPVKMKVFYVNKEMGGFKVVALKGGKQSRSLHLTDKDGKKWVLRTINKSTDKLVPPNFQESFAQDVVKDMLSASDPYGPLGVPPLAEALGVAHASPKYFFVPNDYALGQYRPLFANSVCMLEEFEPVKGDDNAISTPKMFNKLLEDNDHTVDQKSFLKARMLDIFLADFDRHQGQWKWGNIDTGKGRIYYPIPRDRDQAFFYSDGLLMKMATRSRLAFMKGFRYDVPRIRKMGFVARDLDRLYLNDLDVKEWRRSMAEFKAELSDEVINKAASSFPPEISAIDSALFAAKMKSRRDIMVPNAILYYKFLARKVIVRGSNNNELFHVSKNDSGINISVYALDKEGKPEFQMYSRQFDKKVTREIAMYGFNGNDLFKIDRNVPKGIRMVMIGGKGYDTFDVHGRSSNYIYDLKSGGNVVKSKSRTRNMMSLMPEVNDFDEKFNYDQLFFPRPKLGYNVEDKLLIGFGASATTYNFRKKPFSTQQNIGVMISPENRAYQVRYNGVFNHLIHKYDVVANGEFINPTLNNFFGFGNETTKEPGKGIYYYRVRYKYMAGDLLLRKRLFFDKLSISAGPTWYYYWNKYYNNADRILSNPATQGLDSASIYNRKMYGGGKLVLNVNNINYPVFPTRGVDWTTELTYMGGLNDNSRPYSKIQSDMTIYSSFNDPAKLVIVTRLGGGKIFSEQFEYFQALSLGANNFLRGFRKNRFSGAGLAYGSVELRVKLFDLKSYVLPGAVGLIGFNDLGRVWMPNESSDRLHHAYGAGVYYIPFGMIMISATAAISKEETLFNFTIGTKINNTF
ncbi:MAG: BamA/TamA family outer membrane protein [Bacteroidota bacterium]